ncbi:MAG: xanthan lyase [Paludibacter sp.]|nr:xanthan lyase [Paludibacter sp.]
MKHLRFLFTFVAFFLLFAQQLTAQKSTESLISDSLTAIANYYSFVGKIAVSSFNINSKSGRIQVVASDRLSYVPFRPENVQRIYNAIQKIVSSKYSNYKISCETDSKNIEDLIPNIYRTDKKDEQRKFKVSLSSPPLVTNTSRNFDITNGLLTKHIAVWPSHGWHYDQKLSRWEWQRARVEQTVEDLYTYSYVIPYLVPMLEKAGANVFIPRERDTQVNEIIVDNDTKQGNSRYREHNDRNPWEAGDFNGFGNTKKFYIQGENPFTFGTYRKNQSISDADETSTVEWTPDIPETGRYAVYISYKSFLNSITDARYTVFHQGIKTEFSVNQTMNGGTWLYLGHFYFEEGRSNLNKITLSNFSSEDDKIVTADAVKIGGGMGNIARCTYDTGLTAKQKSSTNSTDEQPPCLFDPKISNYPRFTEGARYWLQWAGMPDSIYSKNKGMNDYTDDFQSRGLWVNYLVGGSSVAPGLKGLGVPLDLALAFHTDAGTTKNDSIIGTLGIFSIPNSYKRTSYINGVSRWAARDLTDIVQTQIVNDIKTQFAPEWTRRNMWDKSYSESRVPEIPTMLLELLSHQNFADMRYGLDPRFRFTVSRAIYKGILKYLSTTNGTDYAVQPLPVKQFSCRFSEKNKVELHWLSTIDSLEPTATAEKYVVYTKIDDGDFNNGIIVGSNRYSMNISVGKMYSFKITAINKGGESFDSEILSAYRSSNEKAEILIVNGFDRVSAPANFSTDSTYAGFLNDVDPGVPYLSDISFTGKQHDFKRDKPWVDDDAPGFGACYANYETEEIAGNTFDYPSLHGKAIKSLGFSFVSCSLQAVCNGDIDMNQYKIVDLILGKQKQTFIGNAKKAPEFKTFPLALQQTIKSYCNSGGNLMLSGSFISSDAVMGKTSTAADKKFIENVLKYKYRSDKASVGGEVRIISSPFKIFRKSDFSFYTEPNFRSYYVESPDAIEPNDADCYTIIRYAENNLSAGVAYSGNYKICALGFPFETIQSEKERLKLMDDILLFFTIHQSKKTL